MKSSFFWGFKLFMCVAMSQKEELYVNTAMRISNSTTISLLISNLVTIDI
jgi:hypothetical protein